MCFLSWSFLSLWYGILWITNYGWSDSTKSPAAGIATVSKPKFMSQVGRVQEVMCA